MRTNPTITLEVLLYDITVGKLIYDRTTRRYSFEFTEEYFRSPYDVSPLKLPKKDQQPNIPISNPDIGGVPYFLMDYYYKRRYNSAFEDWCKKYGIEENDPERFIARLAFTGAYGPGAMEFKIDIDTKTNPDTEEYHELTEKSKRIRTIVENLHLLGNRKYLLDVLSSLGLFISGLSRKAAVAIDDDKTIRSERINDTAEQFILKRQLPLNGGITPELTGYEAAKEAGIEISEIHPIAFEGETDMLVKRFDRNKGEKIHTATMETLSPRMKSYEEVMTAMNQMGMGKKDMRQMFKRIVFNVFMNITDCHGGNISFILDRNGKWALAPAYDLVPMLKDGYKHYYSINGKNEGITEEDLTILGNKFHIRFADEIIKSTRSISKKHLAHLRETLGNWQTD